MDILLISGPTAGGKSAAARALAASFNGEIINADAIQVYRELRVLSARPSAAEMAEVPHHLYGHIDAAEGFSAGDWLKAASAKIDEVRGRGRLPVVVGGTGLYFRCLMHGLAATPDIADDIRAHWRARLQREGAAALHKVLSRIDPELAARVPSGDGQRIVRGLEVFEATGTSLTSWQLQGQAHPPLEADFAKYVLLPPREVLAAAAAARIDLMVGQGVLDEVRALEGLSLELPAMKALGLPSLRAHLAGELDLAEAIAQAKIATRQYIRRQLTWIKTQMADWTCVQDEAALYDEIAKICTSQPVRG